VFTPADNDLIITKITKSSAAGPLVFTNLGTFAAGAGGSIAQGSVLCSTATSSEDKLRCTDVQVSAFDDRKDALHCPNHLPLKVTGDFIMPHGVPWMVRMPTPSVLLQGPRVQALQ